MRRDAVRAAGRWIWVGCLALVSASWMFGGLAWAVDLVGMISPAVVAAAWPTAALFLWKKRWLAAMVAFLAGLVAWIPARPLLAPSPAPPAEAATVSLLLVNVQSNPDAVDRLAALALAERPDIVVAIELGSNLAARLTESPGMRDAYPFAAVPRPGEAWPQVMLSRHPMHELRLGDDRSIPEPYQFLYAYRRSYFVDHNQAGRFILTSAHPPSPRTPQTWAAGNQSVERLGEVVRDHLAPVGVPIVIAGDFNTTPWGHRFRLTRDATGLKSAVWSGRRLEGTWPAFLPGPLRLALDQVWASPDVTFLNRQVLENLGSDHRPVLVKMTIPPHSIPDH